MDGIVQILVIDHHAIVEGVPLLRPQEAEEPKHVAHPAPREPDRPDEGEADRNQDRGDVPIPRPRRNRPRGNPVPKRHRNEDRQAEQAPPEERPGNPPVPLRVLRVEADEAAPGEGLLLYRRRPRLRVVL